MRIVLVVVVIVIIIILIIVVVVVSTSWIYAQMLVIFKCISCTGPN